MFESLNEKNVKDEKIEMKNKVFYVVMNLSQHSIFFIIILASISGQWLWVV